ncbi:MAG: aldehyde dehydrogenase family protein [Acidobacteria bacterium]|nr:aldehyde dehydrogenase family protein [Acidobacteriota bacterium]
MLQFYIDGRWVDPLTANPFEVINPATEEVCGHITLGSEADVDKAVAAAVRASDGFASTTRDERVELLQSILDIFIRRQDEIAEAIMEEMGAPWGLAKNAQAPSGTEHIQATLKTLKKYEFEERHGTIAGRLLRWPYRLLIIPIAVGARRSARTQNHAERGDSR